MLLNARCTNPGASTSVVTPRYKLCASHPHTSGNGSTVEASSVPTLVSVLPSGGVAVSVAVDSRSAAPSVTRPQTKARSTKVRVGGRRDGEGSLQLEELVGRSLEVPRNPITLIKAPVADYLHARFEPFANSSAELIISDAK
ncbi:hypothetical protein [Micromonospora inositola]|uniref:hypothetical protein n=1 Tax=Micromonospora inositola TaxID=47865 RepID=UPI0012FD042B|nr:hypothetical protein [Micromonospora inositola]